MWVTALLRLSGQPAPPDSFLQPVVSSFSHVQDLSAFETALKLWPGARGQGGCELRGSARQCADVPAVLQGC